MMMEKIENYLKPQLSHLGDWNAAVSGNELL